MADGDYERRDGKSAELKRLERIIAEARKKDTAVRDKAQNMV